MKKIILLFTILLTNLVFSQEKYLTKTGTVIFEATIPAFEEVKAKNEATTVILNTDNGEFAALVLVKGFRFKNALMEEHFNENYAESDEFPKATFKGKLINFSKDNLDTNTTYDYEGTLSFHGKKKTIENFKLNVIKNADATISINGDLMLSVEDYDIEIPKVVSKKVSKEIKTTLDFTLKKK